MKKIFIPQGTTEKHENLYTDELIVNGRLIVNGIIRARRICGRGVIEAARISANTVIADSLDVEHVCARKLIVNKLCCVTANVSVGIIATDYIEAQSVKTSRLTVALTNVDSIEANEIIRLRPKRSFIGAILGSWLVERFAIWRHCRLVNGHNTHLPTVAMKDTKDTELESVINSYREKVRKGGYRLVLEAVEAEAV